MLPVLVFRAMQCDVLGKIINSILFEEAWIMDIQNGERIRMTNVLNDASAFTNKAGRSEVQT